MDEEYIDLVLEDSVEPNNNIITNPLLLFLQEIEIAVKTGPNQIWGISDSISLARYVFNRYVTISQIKNEIQTYINKHCHHSSMFQYNITVQMLNIENKDLIYIEMSIYTGNEPVIKKFLIGQ